MICKDVLITLLKHPDKRSEMGAPRGWSVSPTPRWCCVLTACCNRGPMIPRFRRVHRDVRHPSVRYTRCLVTCCRNGERTMG